jgi:hypothetical protein
MRKGKKTPAPPPLDVCPENPIIKRKVGRPRKNPTGTDFAYVLQLVRLGFSDGDIKKKLDITDRTFLRWLAENDNRETLRRVRAETELAAYQALRDQAVVKRKVGALGLYLDRIEAAHRGSGK